MIRKQELEQVREINRRLPFAAPIEPGPTFAEWAADSLEIRLTPWQIELGEAMMLGDIVFAPRQAGKAITRAAVRGYVQDGTDG